MDSKKHILIVEDDRAMNDGIAFALNREGYFTHSAYSLKEAEKFLKQKMNLILLDINLPDGDGRDVLKDILAGPPVPVPLGQPPWIIKPGMTRWKVRPL